MSACYKIFLHYFMGNVLLRAINNVIWPFEKKKSKKCLEYSSVLVFLLTECLFSFPFPSKKGNTYIFQTPVTIQCLCSLCQDAYINSVYFFFYWSGWDESSPGKWNSAPWHQTRQYNARYRWRWSVRLQTYRLWCCKRTWRWWTICFSLWHRRVFSKPIWFQFLLRKCLKPKALCE